MTKNDLYSNILKYKSFLCVGLDPDPERIPKHLHSAGDTIFEFNKSIIEATEKYCVAYKLNIAFYESMGIKGWESLQKTLDYIPSDKFTIADGKRGDIGNTSRHYAKTFFDTYAFDSQTVAPYMGSDSLEAFLDYKDKFTIVLGLTSNYGADDFQMLSTGKRKLFEEVLITSQKWGSPENMMYVVGATRADQLKRVREICPEHFLLIPGIGAQGGSLEEVYKYGKNDQIGLLINSSRGIIYASEGKDFTDAARLKSKEIQKKMHNLMAD